MQQEKMTSKYGIHWGFMYRVDFGTVIPNNALITSLISIPHKILEELNSNKRVKRLWVPDECVWLFPDEPQMGPGWARIENPDEKDECAVSLSARIVGGWACD